MGPYYEIPTRRKVTVVTLLASFFALALVVLAVLSYRALAVERRTLLMASVEGEIIATQAQAALQSNDVAVAQTALTLVKSNPQVRAACVYNQDGTIFAKVSDDTNYKFPLAEVNSQVFIGNELHMFRPVSVGRQIIGYVFLRAVAPSVVAGLSHRTPVFLGGCGVLLVATLFFAIWLKRLLALKALDLEPLIPLVPPGAEPSPEPQEILPDEFRLLNRKVDSLSNKVEKIEQQLAKPPKEAKPRVAKNAVQKQPAPVAVVKEELALSALDLNAVTKRVVQTMNEDIQARGAEVAIQSNLPIVFANATVVEQVLRTLISNALKFCPDNSRPRIRIGGCVTGNAVRLWVHDNGVGIAPENQKTIFAGADRESGSGLAAVKRGVEQMRGQVGFDSAAGQGSTFWIELPKSEAATLN